MDEAAASSEQLRGEYVFAGRRRDSARKLVAEQGPCVRYAFRKRGIASAQASVPVDYSELHAEKLAVRVPLLRLQESFHGVARHHVVIGEQLYVRLRRHLDAPLPMCGQIASAQIPVEPPIDQVHIAGVPFNDAPQVLRRAVVSDIDGEIPAALPRDGVQRRTEPRRRPI